jgi:copper transport protein
LEETNDDRIQPAPACPGWATGHRLVAGKHSAHASLARSEPVANAVLEESPQRITIWFTEPIAPEFSRIQLFDAAGTQVDNGDSQVDENDPQVLFVTIPSLPDGLYTVSWRNVSSIDGHSVRGSFLFTIGQPVAGVLPVEPEAESLFVTPAETVLRWLALLGILAVVGGAAFERLVLNPVLARQDSEQMRLLAGGLAGRTFRLSAAALGPFALASTGQLLVHAMGIYETSLSQISVDQITAVWQQTAWGQWWLWRIGFTLGLGGLLFWLRRPAGASDHWLGTLLLLLLGAGTLLTLVLVSHAAATAQVRPAAVFNYFLHLLAGAFWIGGLFHFVLAMPLMLRLLPNGERRRFLTALVPNFSALAILSVATLIVTGLYSAWAQVTVLPALSTPYGVTLLINVGLIVPLLLLGAYNLLWLSPRLSTAEKGGHWLRRSINIEAAVAVLVLLITAVLASLELVRQVASRQGIGVDHGLLFTETAEGAHINLRVEPGHVDPNRFLVTLHTLRSEAAASAGQPCDCPGAPPGDAAMGGGDFGVGFIVPGCGHLVGQPAPPAGCALEAGHNSCRLYGHSRPHSSGGYTPALNTCPGAQPLFCAGGYGAIGVGHCLLETAVFLLALCRYRS